jgi:protein-tyrosine phosphatase
MRKLVEEAGLSHGIEVDSAGTHTYHIDEPPDARAQQAAARRGIDLSDIRGRQATAWDIESFDYVLAMDRDNYRHLVEIRGERENIGLFLEYSGNFEGNEVPDPYYGGAGGFERVLDMIEDACRGLLDDIRERHAL